MPTYASVDQRKFDQLHRLNTKDESIWSILEYYEPNEFNYGARISHLLLIMLDSARWEATRLAGEDIRFTITSDFRERDDKTHGEDPCLGVDIRVRSSRARYFILQGLLNAGFTRIGIYCDDAHIHADIGDLFFSDKYPAEVSWVRECVAEGAV